MRSDFVVRSVNEEPVDDVDAFIDAILAADGEVVLEGYYPDREGEVSYIFEKE